jgi:hypothetical protein
MCGKKRWCSITEDGTTLMCHTPGHGGTERTGKAGTFFLHRLGIASAVAITPQATPEPEAPSPADAGTRITRKQLDYAISLARDRGIARDKLGARCLSEFGKKPEYLTRAEASALIETLKKEAA